MNAVLENIVSSQQASDGNCVDRAEGRFLQEIIEDLKPQRTLEIGCAYGVSTLYICEAAAALPAFTQHIVIDPYQRTQWRGIGLQHVVDAGYGFLVDFREEPSELVLPRLVNAGVPLDFAFVDGWNTFAQVFTEFYYLKRLMRPGGVIAFRDANRSLVDQAIRHALMDPAYGVYGTPPSDAKPTCIAIQRSLTDMHSSGCERAA